MEISRRRVLAASAGLMTLSLNTSEVPLPEICRPDFSVATRSLSAGESNIVRTLEHRKNANYVPQSFSDGHKVALVVEGGGMAGAVTGGLVTAIHDLNLTRSFDAVYASSAGVPVAAYLLAGNPEIGTTLFPENLSDGRFLSVARLFSYAARNVLGDTRPAMDLDYLLRVFKGVEPGVPSNKILDVKKVLSSGIPLNVIVTDLDARQLKIISEFKTPDEFYDYMRASCLVPGVAGEPFIDRNMGGHRLADAKVTRNSPVQQALDDGYTMVVLLSSRPEGSQLRIRGVVADKANWAINATTRLIARDWQEGSALISFTEAQAKENQRELDQALKNPNVMFLGLPADHKPVSSSEMNPNRLREGSSAAYELAMTRLSLGRIAHPQIPVRWRVECRYKHG